MTNFTQIATQHPNYFPGQYLLEEDFELQHKYLNDRQQYQNKSLHVSGIIEGLEVIENGNKVQIKSGSAIDNQGQLIVLNANRDFSEFNSIVDGELYIKYSEEKNSESLQQEKVADSYTRWKENPKVGFAATTPEDGVKLATLTIGDQITIDQQVREYSGVSLPNADGNTLTLRSGGNAAPEQAVLTGSLKIDKDLIVQGSLTIDSDLLVQGIINLQNPTEASGARLSWHVKSEEEWEETLIKPPKAKGHFIDNGNTQTKRAGYGIHMHSSREFGFWSSGWTHLLAIEGGTGNTWIKGDLTVDGQISGKIDADQITSGILSVARIPELSADKIITGTLSVERIPQLSADKITSGTLSVERIPQLSADKITSGTLNGDRIPNTAAAKIIIYKGLSEDITLEQTSLPLKAQMVQRHMLYRGKGPTQGKQYDITYVNILEVAIPLRAKRCYRVTAMVKARNELKMDVRITKKYIAEDGYNMKKWEKLIHVGSTVQADQMQVEMNQPVYQRMVSPYVIFNDVQQLSGTYRIKPTYTSVPEGPDTIKDAEVELETWDIYDERKMILPLDASGYISLY